MMDLFGSWNVMVVAVVSVRSNSAVRSKHFAFNPAKGLVAGVSSRGPQCLEES